MIFENIIIGKGLVGAAAAKYLQKNSGDVAIIGPDEPDVIEDALFFPVITMKDAFKELSG